VRKWPPAQAAAPSLNAPLQVQAHRALLHRTAASQQMRHPMLHLQHLRQQMPHPMLHSQHFRQHIARLMQHVLRGLSPVRGVPSLVCEERTPGHGLLRGAVYRMASTSRIGEESGLPS
jgi:hypothetical protein